jgi:hypothetical protein
MFSNVIQRCLIRHSVSKTQLYFYPFIIKKKKKNIKPIYQYFGC